MLTMFVVCLFFFGLMGLLRFLLHPKHFSGMAADRQPLT